MNQKYLWYIGEKVTARRQELGAKEKAQAQATGMTRLALNKIENGSYRNLQPELLNKLAAYLGTPVQELMPPVMQ